MRHKGQHRDRELESRAFHVKLSDDFVVNHDKSLQLATDEQKSGRKSSANILQEHDVVLAQCCCCCRCKLEKVTGLLRGGRSHEALWDEKR
jgi:hypothetical protein